jgi:glutamate dehydrogenase
MSKESRSLELQLDTILSAITQAVGGKSAAKDDLLHRFTKRYVGNTPAPLSSNATEQFVTDIAQAWHFVQERKSSRPLISFEEALLEENGRQLPTTVVRVLLDDKPFIVDSLRQALLRSGATIKAVRNTVLFSGRRKPGAAKDSLGRFGELADLATKSDDDFSAESFCSITCARWESERSKGIESELRDSLNHVSAAVGNYKEMTSAAANLRRNLLTNAEYLPVSEENVAESIEFIGWLIDNHFTFLGYEKYRIREKSGESIIELEPGSLLGVSRYKSQLRSQTKVSSLPGAAADFISRPKLLSFAKSSKRSKVHRPAYYDYVLIKEFDKAGQVTHMHRFLGLYTSSVYFREALSIPLIRKKVSRALENSGYTNNGHNMKDLMQVINTFPRDELFQISSRSLLDIAVGITKIRDTGTSKLFVRKDFYGRFVSCLVYIPRELFNTKSRVAIQSLLQARLQAEDVDFNTYLSESSQARIHLVFKVPTIRALKVDQSALEREIVELIRPWEEDFMERLREAGTEDEAQQQYGQFAECFSSAYKDAYTAAEAVEDVRFINAVASSGDVAVNLRESHAERAEFSFKLFSLESQLMLSDVDPILENLGLRIISESTYPLRGNCALESSELGPRIWLHDFLVYRSESSSPLSEEGREFFEQAFYAIWSARVEDDSYNALVLNSGLTWREAAFMRALGAYLKQIRFDYSQGFIAETLSCHAQITSDLMTLFTELFEPSKSKRRFAAYRNRIVKAIDAVSNLSKDSVLRAYLGLIDATLRSNFFQLDSAGELKDYFSFKFEPQRIDGVPKPLPKYEIFVYSSKVEGVHLRGGKVARGGLRWSDRREDYRTEILGLVKAQQVKNSVIVPVGAKGGFVVKDTTPVANRAEFQARGIRAYETFIAGLLDITDNLKEGTLIAPEQVVRRDEDDPYLVVAADKGTATFSDIANGIAARYGFWLGDGFASGGSNGYDHKAMGITAKGAWISVQRHFRERGIDIQKEEFSVVGIGDMSGDVFGNGMLLSPKILLKGAFNHMHIFIDPTPNASVSFKERKRLFKQTGSSWDDYQRELISAGGGVFERSSKSIALTDEMRIAFATDARSLTPDQLISVMLKAPVDLLWNGGIGTYVKSFSESNATVGDKANDSLRVDARDLRCKAIGEGGNLGMTQLSRIEYGLKGGISFTDFIDNSAGVDCSDHEVNIKILLNEVANRAPARSEKAQSDADTKRSALLEGMTDEVSALVLANNYRQVQTLALTFADPELGCKEFNDLINFLETSAGLDREIEFLPSAEQLEQRASAHLAPTRPELAVATSYMKMFLKAQLVSATYLNDPLLQKHLFKAFPGSLVKRYAKAIDQHPLRSELMATQLANYLVNRVGAYFVFELISSSSASPARVVRASILAIEALDAESQWQSIESLDYSVASSYQDETMLALIKLVRDATRWLLRNRPATEDLVVEIKPFAIGVKAMVAMLPSGLPKNLAKKFSTNKDALVKAGLPQELADCVAKYSFLAPAFSLIDVSQKVSESLATMISAYYLVGDALRLDWLGELIVE